MGLLFYRLFLLLVWTVLALPGVILAGPVFLVASIMSRKKQKGTVARPFSQHTYAHFLIHTPEALAASVVKIAARDVLASWKVLISLGVAPLVYGLYAVLATVVVAKTDVPLWLKIWTPMIVMWTLPFLGYAALKFGEAGMDVLK